MSNSDQIQRILFDDIDVRGVVSRLDASYAEVLARADYPPVIRNVLGEMMAAVSLLSSTLKLEGRLILQAQGEGALKILMAECNHHHELRAIARFDDEIDNTAAFNELLLNGRLALTIEPEQGQRYQGVVPLDGATLAECLETYFRQSEQLPTMIRLAADGQRAAGLLLQVLPAAGTGSDDWERISLLASTLSADELLGLDNDTMLFRLFHEEQCRLYEPEPLQFKCDCSQERSANALQMMTEEELLSLAQEHGGSIDVTCHFCNQVYSFDSADIRTLFSNAGPITPSDRIH